MSPDSPIVVLDSGLGGLTVVRALQQSLPHERILYFGDTARVPYGHKSPETVTTFVRQIVSYLLPHGPKHVVIACNTATALAMPSLRTAFPGLSFSGVIEPGAKAAAVAAGPKLSPVIGVIATEATVKSRAYDRALHRRRGHARVLLRPTPLLVPMIEEGRDARDPVLRLALRQYLSPLAKNRVEVLVLGCTHYPVLKGLIARMMGEKVRVIDSAEQCAEDVARRLGAANLLRSGGRGMEPPEQMLQCCVTDDPERFARLAPQFLGREISEPSAVSLDDLAAAVELAPAAGAFERMPMRVAV